MSGTYSDPKGYKRHIPGKVDHDADSAKDVLVDGNGNPTKIGAEMLSNGDAGEDTRGVDQVNISAMPMRQEERHRDPASDDPNASDIGPMGAELGQPVHDERQPNTGQVDGSGNLSETSNVRQQRQYPEGNKPKPDVAE